MIYRSQAASSGPPGLHPAQKVPMGLSTIAGYSNTGSVSGLASASHGSSRYSTPSAQVAQAAQVAVSAMTGAYAGLAAQGSFPISPDVKLKKLPFYDILSELLRPSTLGK